MKENFKAVKKRWIAGGLSLAMMVSVSGHGLPFPRGGATGEETEDFAVSLSTLGAESGGQGISIRTLNTDTPMLGASTPEIGSGTPEIGASTPEIGSGTPEIGASTPDIGASTPDTGSSVPEIGVSTPEIGSGTPEVGASTPETAPPEASPPTAPEIGSGTPEIGTAVPETGENVLAETEGNPEGSEDEEALPEGEEYSDVHGDANVDMEVFSVGTGADAWKSEQTEGKSYLTISLPNGENDDDYVYDVTLAKSHYKEKDGEYVILFPPLYDTHSYNDMHYYDNASGGYKQVRQNFLPNYLEGTTSGLENYVNSSTTITGVRGGTDLVVYNIAPEYVRDDGNGFDYVYFEVTVKNTNTPDKNATFTNNPTVIAKNGTENTMAGAVVDITGGNPTDDTYETLGGKYTLAYLLNRYNAVSFGYLEGSHIVGPVIALDYAARTGYTKGTEASNSTLVVSDYTTRKLWDDTDDEEYVGQFSYIGNLLPSRYHPTNPIVQLNYGFDYIEDSSFDSPYLYTSATNQYVVEDIYEKQFILRSDGSTAGTAFTSPNDFGMQEVYQKNEFISKTLLQEAVTSGSDFIAQNGYLEWDKNKPEEYETLDISEFKTSDNQHYVEITYGNSYNITNTNDLGRDWYVVMDFTEHEYGTGDTKPTVINVAKEAVQKVDGEYVFPQVKVRYTADKGAEASTLGGLNLKAINSTGYGKDVEYNIHGNRVVWNFHDFVGDVRFPENFNDIPGHIIIPQGSLINQKGDGWIGGNLNGCVIAQTIEMGLMEVHMWPYGGDDVNVEEPYEDPEQNQGGSGSTDSGHILPETGGRVDLLYLTGSGVFGFGLILFWVSRKKSGVI